LRFFDVFATELLGNHTSFMIQFRLPLLCSILVLSSVLAQAQIQGGRTTYSFLRLPPTARISGLAGNLITVVDDDVSLAFGNPAALNPLMHQQIAFNHGFLPAGISFGSFNYGQRIGKKGLTAHGGFQYINYGEIDLNDEFFQTLGTFKASETALCLGAAYPVYDRLNLGANLRIINSSLATFSSLGLAADLAATYQDTARRTVWSLVVRNAGGQLSPYAADLAREPLPFDVQLGFSKRLKYLPFRFSIIYTDFNRWNVLYDDPNQENGTLFDEDQAGPGKFSLWLDNFARHFIFNGELLIGARENFRLRFGYNYRLHKELSVQGFSSLAGFSFGTGIKVNRFRIDFGRSVYHLAGGQTQLSIATNFREFKK
jgi:hypothetical protein